MDENELLQTIKQAADYKQTLLNLSGKELTSLPQINQLSSLEMLNLRDNRLTTLPPEIGQLSNLMGLDLSGNQLTVLPSEIGRLSNLRQLYLDGNQLTTLPSEIGQLFNLTQLYLDGNQLTALPSEIGQLSNLMWLRLNNNQLTALPPEIDQLTKLKEFGLIDNPLQIPSEILERTEEPAIIINYYLQHLASQKKLLNEAKMILVGQGGVGKTSLVKRLVEGNFDPNENKTEGIDIKRWQVRVNDQKIRLNIWDFGGQEIMHATHQFFLTKRSLYILVIDARLGEDENRVEYWLKLIKTFGGDSPVIIVGNKIDQQALDLNRRGLQVKYKTIKAFVEISCQTNHGLDELRTVIVKEIGALEHIQDQLLNTWFTVKACLEEMEQDYITYDAYKRLCQTEKITDDLSQRTLIRFLHDLGIVVNFQDDPRLEDTNILNPEWVTNGVYKILNSNALFQSKGVLERKMLNKILDSREYPISKHLFIVDMMRKFELCFDFEGFTNKKFLIPDLLTKEEPYTGDWHDVLAFQYHYNILPSSVISRFIVRMHPSIHQNTYWRSGVVLAYGGNKALIKADKEDRKISIWVSGPKETGRTFLAIIRSHFDYIHQTISGIEAREKIPLPDYPEIVVDYNHLLDLEELDEESFVPEGLRKRVNVKQLLGGFESEQKRRRVPISRQDNIKRLITDYTRRLQKLKEQQAQLGVNTPPEILTEIEDIEAKIETLQSQL